MPTMSTAAILEQQRQPLRIADVRLPLRLEYGQVLVEVCFSGICGSQLGEIDGRKGPDRYLPHLLGHEGSGRVVETGPGVTTVADGDHVVLHWRPGAGIQCIPPKYEWEGRVVNAGWVTTFNQYAVVSENRVTAIPSGVDLRIAALFGCAVTTGLGVVRNNAKVQLGDSVLVYGAGGVGLNIIQGAALAGAFPIVAVDLFENRLALAARLGATHCLCVGHGEIESAVRAVVGDSGVDVAIDNTGNTDVIASCYRLAGAKGRVILVGVPKSEDDICIHSLPLHFGKVITGSHGGEADPPQDIPRYLKLWQAGKLELDTLVSDEFPLHEINTAISRMRGGEITGRCLIRFSE